VTLGDAVPAHANSASLRPGISPPLIFHVGQLPEVTKRLLAIPDPQGAQALRAGGPARPAAPPSGHAPTIVTARSCPAVSTLPFAPGRARPRQSPSPPANSSPTSPTPCPAGSRPPSPHGPDGREVDTPDHFRHDQDPVLCVQVSRTRLHPRNPRPSIYRPRGLRLSHHIREVPYGHRQIFPLGSAVGARTNVELFAGTSPRRRARPRNETPASSPHRPLRATVSTAWSSPSTRSPGAREEAQRTPATAQAVTLRHRRRRIAKPGRRVASASRQSGDEVWPKSPPPLGSPSIPSSASSTRGPSGRHERRLRGQACGA